MKHMKRMISVIAAALVLLTASGGVHAEGKLPVKLALKPSITTVRAGQSFRVNVALQFDSNFLAEAGGITVMKWNLKFNPDMLQILDPYTMSPLSFGDNGRPSSGSLYRFGNIGQEGAFETRANADGNGIIMLYAIDPVPGDIEQAQQSYITEAGDFVQLAFCPKADLAVNGKETIRIELTEAEISPVNSGMKPDVSGDALSIDVLPSFTVPELSVHKQNTTLTIAGRGSASDRNSDITVAIAKDGNVIEEKTESLASVFYSMEFELDEARYPVGTYQVTFRSGDSMAMRILEIVAKDAPPTVDPGEDPGKEPDKDPDKEPGKNPETPTSPDEPSKPDGDKDNTGGSTGGNTNGNKGGGSGGSSGGSAPIVTSPNGNTQPSVDAAVSYPTDIATHWAADNIKYVYKFSLMNGYLDGTFAPNGNITRAEFVTVMMRYLGLDENPSGADGFTDVSGHWAKGAVGALAASGIVSGVSEHEFDPDSKITREGMAVILSRALHLAPAESEAAFIDRAEISDWAADGVDNVAAAGIMKGDETGAFLPHNNATRAEVATVIRRLHEAVGSR